MSVLLLHCYGAHRDLHSFPTRRSSDLRLDSLSMRRQTPVKAAVKTPVKAANKAAVRRAERRPPRRTKTSDRKSTRLNSSHGYISYAVFCLKKKSIDMDPLTTSSTVSRI